MGGCGCSEGAGLFPMTGGGAKKSLAKTSPKCLAKTKGTLLTAKDVKTLETCMAKIKSVIEGATCKAKKSPVKKM
jgi:hypothetical protein